MSFFVVISQIREAPRYSHDIVLYRPVLSYWHDGQSPAVVVLWCQSARQRPGRSTTRVMITLYVREPGMQMRDA